MRLIIAGSRHMTCSVRFLRAVLSNFNLKPRQIVSGACGLDEDCYVLNMDWPLYANGVDGAGEKLAVADSMDLRRFPAKWSKHGKMAGPLRNKEMAEYADALLLIWDGKSKGSRSMRKEMLNLDKPVYSVIIETHNT